MRKNKQKGTTTNVDKFISRRSYFREIAKNCNVLHLGCSSGTFLKARINRGSLLHTDLHNSANILYGIDLDGESLGIMREELGYDNLYEGDVQKLENISLNENFDIVLAGDLLEHITCPGAMLEGIKPLLSSNGSFVISTVNAFGLHFQIKRWLGRYVEHFEHICFYSPETLVNLFERHSYEVKIIYGAYTEPPFSWSQKIKFIFGYPLFKLFPVLAGTLIVVATPKTN